MKECISCKESMRQCMDTHTFAFAHLYNDEKAMDMHIHDCYEIYYSISGGKQFLIDLCQIMALKLVDEKKIAGADVIKAVVDQKLLAAGNGKIDLIAVMDVHGHRLFIII